MSVKDLTNDQILDHLKKNTILRNNQLSVLVKLLNSLNDSATLAIDGAWGSGKTVFVKQLQILADKDISDYGNDTLDKAAIKMLRTNQKAFYFNAWENDYVNDALGALLLKLIAEADEGLTDTMVRKAFKMIDPAAYIENISHDLINTKADIKRDELVKYLKPLVDRHEAINDFIDQIKGDKQRVIFIIDELDRCKPSFAVDLLEVIKHYFIRNDVTFIVATNTSELSHTVKKYYGNDFNGPGYLNKFFDFTYTLNRVDVEHYTRNAIDWNFDGGMISGAVRDAINYCQFQMREINAYISSLRLVESYMATNYTYSGSIEANTAVRYLFVPLALALKIRNGTEFTEFTSGTASGKRILRAFAESSNEIRDFVRQLPTGEIDINSDSAQIEKIQMDNFIDLYADMFERPSRQNRIAEYLPSFLEVTSLLGSYTTISDSSEEGG